VINGDLGGGREVLIRLDDLSIGAVLQELALRGATPVKVLREDLRFRR